MTLSTLAHLLADLKFQLLLSDLLSACHPSLLLDSSNETTPRLIFATSSSSLDPEAEACLLDLLVLSSLAATDALLLFLPVFLRVDFQWRLDSA